MKVLLLCFILAGLVTHCPAPMLNRELEEKIDTFYNINEGMDLRTARDMEFGRYILRVVDRLSKDEVYIERRKTKSTMKDIEEGRHWSKGLYADLSDTTRERLDTLKLAEIEFQEELIKASKTHMLEKTKETEWNPIHHTDKKFSQKDLDLILSNHVSQMRYNDAKRRQGFKEHQMEKELKHREDLEKAKSDEDRKILEEREEQHHKKKHDPLHMPLSGPQFREIWLKKDGLDPEYFDLKTLFKLHDNNGDDHLDEFELKTMFLADLDKAYHPDDQEYDPVERDEELERMREFALKRVDTDQDGRVSLDEMLAAKAKEDFEVDKEYKPLYERKNEFTEEELTDFKKNRDNITE